MVLFAPSVASVWHELGVLSAQIGKLRQATASLEKFLALEPFGEERKAAESLLKKIRASLN